ncbi:hypothetical protein BRADI_1g74055v3 [Brachypodium distachyon]|uniref:Uncharacterized protein n=1 Tax=Brachypodium distachyon TaxID=15368 RepID=A0A2K2DV28_BRADI|nr:hypothetical protein BRADI_1g74055v3 [Brachypodium distachyon]
MGLCRTTKDRVEFSSGHRGHVKRADGDDGIITARSMSRSQFAVG